MGNTKQNVEPIQYIFDFFPDTYGKLKLVHAYLQKKKKNLKNKVKVENIGQNLANYKFLGITKMMNCKLHISSH